MLFIWRFSENHSIEIIIIIFFKKTDLISITTFCIFNFFSKDKSSSESILIFLLWEQMDEILLFNVIRYLILLNVFFNFSEWTNVRYFLIYPSTLSKKCVEVLHRMEFCIQRHKLTKFHVIFRPIKYYQDQNHYYWLCDQNNNICDF